MSITLKDIPFSIRENDHTHSDGCTKRLESLPIGFHCTPAHPIWARQIWQHLDNHDQLDVGSMKDQGIDGNSLFSNTTITQVDEPWTYMQWYELYYYALDKLGPSLPAYLGGMMGTSTFVLGEEVLCTSPNLRSIFSFWDQRLSMIDPLSTFTCEKTNGGVRIYVSYAVSGSIETYFALGGLAMINVAHRMTTGMPITTGANLNMHNPHSLTELMQDQCQIKIDSWSKKRDLHCPSNPSQTAQIEVNISDRLLDATSPSWDAVRHTRAMRRFEETTTPLAEVSGTCISDLAESIQLTCLAPLTSIQMAEKLGISESGYRKRLAQCGTSHKVLQRSCIAFNVESLERRGCSRAEIVRMTGIDARRLDRILDQAVTKMARF